MKVFALTEARPHFPDRRVSNAVLAPGHVPCPLDERRASELVSPLFSSAEASAISRFSWKYGARAIHHHDSARSRAHNYTYSPPASTNSRRGDRNRSGRLNIDQPEEGMQMGATTIEPDG